MADVFIFSGTTEGRQLAEFLCRQDVPVHVCVATEYGGELMREHPLLRVHAGRRNTEEIAALLRQLKVSYVVDATHPYAVSVSENIRSACALCDEPHPEYIRLQRESDREAAEDCVTVATVEEAVSFLAGTTGKILAATGSKELAYYTALPDYKERVTARVLSTPGVAAACAELGFQGKNLICMQGPFSKELNTAILRQIGAKWMVTKESGKEGGFQEKLLAARDAGVQVVLVGRPPEPCAGLGPLEVRALLCRRLKLQPKREITLAGIGMGNGEGVTQEVRNACLNADLLIGAKRMLDAFSGYGKRTFCSYKTDEIREYVYDHPEYENIVVLLSGDIGFYSGAKKLYEAFEKEEIRVCPGISSVSYFCAKLHVSWEDVKLLSLHGRNANFTGWVKRSRRVFALVGEPDGVNRICQKLLDYGMTEVRLSVGERLSYPDEKIRKGTPKELIGEVFDPLCVLLAENQNPESVLPCGIADERFIRDRVPMTKSEVRSVSLSKLAPASDSIIYDIGAGTGSVSVEAALHAVDGRVYAIEKKETAVSLIRKNKEQFGTDNLEIVPGTAPEALTSLPAPTHVFIGGSSGNLREILACVLEKNPHVRIVMNVIALETLTEAVNCMRELPLEDIDIVSVTAAKAKEIGSYHMMLGQNPVYVISCTGKGADEWDSRD